MVGSVLPDGFAVRAAEMGDAADIAHLLGSVDEAFGLEPWANESDISEDFGDPDLDLSRDTWIVEEGDAG